MPGHPDDEVQVDGYCAGGGRSGDHCGEKQIRRDKVFSIDHFLADHVLSVKGPWVPGSTWA